ncbi:MAG: iron ABC transporter permease [Deltaproteobacteria bacterium]|nr:MAG: iron ABC transporter permease [Deltaproteobacteria bacterium]
MPELDLATALSDATSWQHAALYKLQLPRIAQGLVVGATLAVSGAALQGLLRNPLADPFILGVSGGAALGSAAVTLMGLGTALLAPLGGFLGALGALLVVTALATEGGRIAPLRMLLIGVVFNALAGAGLMVLQALADPGAVQLTLMRLMGSVGADPSEPLLLPLLAVASGIGIVATLLSARGLNLLALGDETARSLGVAPDRLRLVLFVLISVAVGATVAVTGLIGFVGLIVPHAVRLVVGPDHRLLLPLSALAGAGFVVVADAAVSALAPAMGTELPVGVVTALVGGPMFLALLRRRPARVAE